jgi:hypothetical protein
VLQCLDIVFENLLNLNFQWIVRFWNKLNHLYMSGLQHKEEALVRSMVWG